MGSNYLEEIRILDGNKKISEKKLHKYKYERTVKAIP